MFPTYNLREADRSQRKLPQFCLVGDLLETGEWLVKIDGQYPSCSLSRFTFLDEEGQWHPITKLTVKYGGGYPSYVADATLRFDDKSMGRSRVEVVLIMEKKRNDPKYQQLLNLQKPI